MTYKKKNAKDNTITNMIILLVFAYLRNRIFRRPNRLKPEERSVNGIEQRRKRCPEAYDGNVADMAKEIGVSAKTFSKAVDILEYDLKLIVTDRMYRVTNDNGEFRTLPTVFANAYKRDDKYLLAFGEDYSRSEIQLKVDNMSKHYKKCKIDTRKRKRTKEK